MSTRTLELRGVGKEFVRRGTVVRALDGIDLRTLADDCLCPTCLAGFAKRDHGTGNWVKAVPHASIRARGVPLVWGLGALVFRLWFGPLRGRPTQISKINTAAQLLYLTIVMVNAAVNLPPQEIVDALAILTLVTTVLSGLHYVVTFTRRAWTQPAQFS